MRIVSNAAAESESLTPGDEVSPAAMTAPGFPPVPETLAWLPRFGRDRIHTQMIDERRTITPHVVLEFGNRGLLGMPVPPAWGGPGYSNADMIAAGEQLGALDITLGAFVGVNTALGIYPILKHGSPDQKRRWLPALGQGRALAAFALTEEGAGSDPRSIKAEARRQPSGTWRITGEKIWIGTAAWSSVIHIFAHAFDETGKPLGITGFSLPTDTPGIHQDRETLTLGLRGMVQNRVRLDGAEATDADLLGRIGGGLEVAADAMCYGRMGLSSIAVGAIRRCAQMMALYAGRRHVGGALLIDRFVVRARIASALSGADAVMRLLERMAERLDTGATVPAIAYVAVKIIAPELAFRAADDLVQTLGGRGYDEANLAPQFLRDARILRIFEGPTETMQVYLGTLALFQFGRLATEAAELSPLTARREAIEAMIAGARDAIAAHEEEHGRAGVRGVTEALALCLGEIVAWCFLEAVAADVRAGAAALDPDVLVWLEAQVEQRVTQLERMLTDIEVGVDAAALSARLARVTDAIGPPPLRRDHLHLTTDPMLANEDRRG